MLRGSLNYLNEHSALVLNSKLCLCRNLILDYHRLPINMPAQQTALFVCATWRPFLWQSWLASRTELLLLLLRGVSIYTANKLNFSFMTPTTVSPVVGGWMPSQRRQTIVWQLSKVCRAAPATPPRRTDVYIWLVISQRRPRRWHQVQVGSTWPAEKSQPPSRPLQHSLWMFRVSFGALLSLPCHGILWVSFKGKFGGLKAHSLFVSLKISSWA